MIVIDIGCAKYGGDFSIERLLEEFRPEVLYGFDPMQGPDEYPWPPNPPDGPTFPTKAMRTYIEKKAAWTYDGEIGFSGSGLGGHIDPDGENVPCFDLAGFIRSLPSDHEIALKIDAEGAEYDLLEHLIATRTDELLKLAWVEWHPKGQAVNSRPDKRRDLIEERIECDLHQWNW